MEKLHKAISVVWRVIELLLQIVIVFVLAALLLGEDAGVAVNQVYSNVLMFLTSLPPASIAVAILLGAVLWWNRK